MPTRSHILVFVALASFAPIPLPARAATLAAAKPSEVVVAFGGSNDAACGTLLTLREIASKVTSDGSTAPFVIPLKQVFVLTSVDWITLAGPVNHRNGVGIYIVNAARTEANVVVRSGGMSDADGQASGTVTIPSGVVVKAGAHLCTAPTDAPLFGYLVTLHGFLTKDK